MDIREDKVDRNPSAPLYTAERSLEEMDHILHQMLLLAELSASSVELDRFMLQRGLERLEKRIDRIADQLDNLETV